MWPEPLAVGWVGGGVAWRNWSGREGKGGREEERRERRDGEREREGEREERLLFASYVDTRMVRLRMWVSLCNNSK